MLKRFNKRMLRVKEIMKSKYLKYFLPLFRIYNDQEHITIYYFDR